MRVTNPSFEILHGLDAWTVKDLELYGRVAYKSEERIREDTARVFVKAILDRQHESVIEHASATVRIVCDRGVSHELVRHRIASYTQESTRYCNYAKAGFGNEITVIEPPGLDEDARAMWVEAVHAAERAYINLIALGQKPQIARAVLPNCLKTEIIVTMNLRSWRNFFKLRTAKSAHPQMREIAIPMLQAFKQRVPVVFDDIEVGE